MARRKNLEFLVELLNRRLARPTAEWTRDKSGKLTANIGHITLDYYQPGGNPYTYALEEVSNTGGGVRTLNHHQMRMTPGECAAYLNGWHDALDAVKRGEANP